MDQLYALALQYLPPNLAGILLDPPSLTRPSSWLPVVRAAIPYSSWIVAVLALYVLYAVLSGLIAHVARFVRFALRIGPIFGLLAWLLSASGQGDAGDVLGALKAYAGFGENAAARDTAPGVAALKDLLGAAAGAGTGAGRGKKSGGGWADTFGTSSAKTRGGAGARGARQEKDSTAEAVDAVQDFVKEALVKAAGLDWLLGSSNKDEGRKGKSR
ncbi:hypothetical protein Q5752_003571 [Cryptotrichosporon argae]